MVIISTRADEVIIQDVSPGLSGSLVAAKAPPAVSMRAPSVAAAPRPMRLIFSMFMLSFLEEWAGALKRVAVGFAGADAHDLLERGDEDFSVPDLAGFRLD